LTEGNVLGLDAAVFANYARRAKEGRLVSRDIARVKNIALTAKVIPGEVA
jgi:hypothetical protein